MTLLTVCEELTAMIDMNLDFNDHQYGGGEEPASSGSHFGFTPEEEWTQAQPSS